jgi:hypothetical protein
VNSYPRNIFPLLRPAIAIFALTANLIPIAKAAETASSIGYQLEYTDNALLVPTNKQEEWTHVLNAGFSLIETGPSLDGKVLAEAAYRDYKNNIFSDDTTLKLNSNILWKISPDRFSWTVEDYLTQTTILSLAPDTPSNREQVNVFVTGPDYKLRLSPAQALKFGARYARNSYETTDLDNTRNSGEISWIYQTSPITSFSLNYAAQTVRYDDNVINVNFDRQDTYFQIEDRLSRNIFVLSAGATSIQRDNLPDEKGSLGRFSWTRLVSTVSTFSLSVASELSDVGRQALAAGQAASANQQTIPGASNTGDIFRTNSASVTFNRRRSFGRDVISLFREKDEYKTSPVVEERKGGNIDIGYEFADSRAASIFAGYVKTQSNLTTPDTEYKDKNLGLRFFSRFAKKFTVGLQLGRNKRENVDVLQSYTERKALLALSYSESANSGTTLFK